MSFQENLAAAVDAVGFRNVGIVWGLAMTPWESTEQRDEFLSLISGKVMSDG